MRERNNIFYTVIFLFLFCYHSRAQEDFQVMRVKFILQKYEDQFYYIHSIYSISYNKIVSKYNFFENEWESVDPHSL